MISNLTKETWDPKIIGLGGSILQSWAWGEFQASLGWKIYRFSDDDFAALAIETELPFGKKYLYCPKGPLGNVEGALADLRKFSTNKDLIFARIEPNEKVTLPHAVKEVQPKQNWVLDLEQSEEELLVRMKPKTRYNINLAARKKVLVKTGEQKDLLVFWKLMLETASRQNFKLHPQNYYWQMWDHLAPQNLKLVLAYYNSEPVAGMLLTLFGQSAIYLHGGTSQKFKDAMAPFALHWEAIRIAKASGMKFYDFGGVTGEANPNHAWAGITRFKKSFGGFEVVYPGAYDLIYSPIWYNVYKNARALKKVLNGSH